MKRQILLTVLIAAGQLCCRRTPQERAAAFLKHGKEFMASGDFARATLEFRNAARLEPKNAEPAYQLGLAELNRGDLNQAIAEIFRATRLDPRHPGARVKLAELMARSGDPKLVREAESRMLDLLGASPENIDALDTAALAEIQLGQFDSAEKHLEEALRALPHNLASNIELASYYIKQHQPERAEAALRDAQAAAPKSVEAATALADFYVLTNRVADAEKWFRVGNELSPADQDIALQLASVERLLGKHEEAERLYKKVAALPGTRNVTVYADYLMLEGRRDDAIRELQKLARHNPQDRHIRTLLVVALVFSGKSKEATAVLNAALAGNSNDSDALVQKSAILIHSGNYKEAQTDLDRLIHFKPDSAEAHYLLARVSAGLGDTGRENAELTEAIHVDASFWPAREALAELFVRSRSPDAATDLLAAAPEAQKHTLPFILARNMAAYAAGDTKAFRAGVAEALRAGESPEALLQDAVVKLKDGDYSAGRVSLQRVLAKEPENVRAIRAMLFSYAAQNDAEGEKRFLVSCVEDSRSPAVQELAAESLWSAGDHANARAALARAKAIDASYLPADLAIARADIADGNPARARDDLQHVLAADPNNFAAHIMLAALETRNQNYEAAIAHYRKALDAQPNNVQALNNIAYILADKLNNADTALPYAQQAVEAASDSADALGTLGWVLYRKGLYTEAGQLLKRAVAADRGSKQPNAVMRRYHLAMSYRQTGDQTLAQETFTKALLQNPNLPEAAAAGQLLR